MHAAARAGAVAAGLAVDAVIGDPRRGHPVAVFGSASTRLQRLTERRSRPAGVVHLTACVAGVVGPALLVRRSRVALVWATWATVGGTTLGREASRIAASVGAGDLTAARDRLPYLCGRDPSALDATGVLRGVVESVGENTSDAVVGPLVWSVLGVPGVLAFRVVNTLDAMVGHRSERYEQFGWASARADDGAGLVPSRLTALLFVALAPLVGGSSREAWAAWRSDAGAHPSPNAGPVEAAFAGALGLRLGGPVTYPYGESPRPWLNGGGRDPVVADVARAVRLSRAASYAAAAVCLGIPVVAR